MKHDYIVAQSGYVAGQYYEKGAEIHLTEVQAKYENLRLKSESTAKTEPTSKGKGAKAK